MARKNASTPTAAPAASAPAPVSADESRYLRSLVHAYLAPDRLRRPLADDEIDRLAAWCRLGWDQLPLAPTIEDGYGVIRDGRESLGFVNTTQHPDVQRWARGRLLARAFLAQHPPALSITFTDQRYLGHDRSAEVLAGYLLVGQPGGLKPEALGREVGLPPGHIARWERLCASERGMEAGDA